MLKILGIAKRSLRQKLDVATYRRIMAYPTWGFLMQAIVATRSYDAGREGALLLLCYTGENRQSLLRPAGINHHLTCAARQIPAWAELSDTVLGR